LHTTAYTLFAALKSTFNTLAVRDV